MAAPSVLPDAASRKGSAERLQGVVLFLSAAVLAFLLYRPDTSAPFEIIDFSETLPFLTDGRDFGERFSGLVGYYLQHGRAAFGLSAGLAAKWTLFEWWTPGWQWTRYGVGLGVVVLAWRLLRALGANRTGASVGAALFIVSEAAAPGWLRPAVNEPFGTLLLFAASLVACRYQRTARPGVLAAAIAVLLALMIVVKETLVAAAFFPVVLALCIGPDGMLAWPARSSRNLKLVALCATAIAIAAVPVVWALAQAAPDGYARQFGSSESLISNAIFGVLPAVIPFTPVSQPPGWAATVADVAWLVLLMAGLRASQSDPAARRHDRMLVWIALALPLARLLVYLPWPLQFPYYSIPYLTGVAIVSAMGVTNLSQVVGTHRRFMRVIPAAVLLYSVLNVATQASRHFATRRLTDALVTELHRLSRVDHVDTVIVAVPRLKEQSWWGLAPTLSRLASATGRPLPYVVDKLCPAARAELGAHGVSTRVTALRWQCDLGAKPAAEIRFLVRRLNLTIWRMDYDTLVAEIHSTAFPR